MLAAALRLLATRRAALAVIEAEAKVFHMAAEVERAWRLLRFAEIRVQRCR